MTLEHSLFSPDGKVRWGIVGTGHIAGSFATDIGAAGNATLAAVCSRTPQSAERFAARFRGIRIITDIAAMAADPDIDAVYVASPNAAHLEQAQLLISAGKPVLVEKPLVTTRADAETLAKLSADNQVFAMEALWTIFLPAIDRVKALLADEAIGPIRHVRAELAYEKVFDAESRFFSKTLGGGALLDLGIYTIALASALFGAPQTVTGDWRAAPTGVDVSARLRLAYPNFVADLSCGFDRSGANRFVIEGERGAIIIDAPFLRASRVFVTHNALALALVDRPSPGILSRLTNKLARALPLPGLARYRHDIAGSGLQFEIAAASAAILKGETQDRTWPLQASIDTLAIIETILSQPPS